MASRHYQYSYEFVAVRREEAGGRRTDLVTVDNSPCGLAALSDLFIAPPAWTDNHHERGRKVPALSMIIDTPFAVANQQFSVSNWRSLRWRVVVVVALAAQLRLRLPLTVQAAKRTVADGLDHVTGTVRDGTSR